MKVKVYELIGKYKNISAPAKASIWYIVCNVLQKGISLLTTPIFTRFLTTEEYGLYTIYQSWYSIVVIFATLYLASGVYNNGLVKFPEDKAAFTSSMLGLTFVCSGIILVLFLIFPQFWTKNLELPFSLLLAIIIQSITTAVFNFWAKQERFSYSYIKLVIVTLVISVCSPFLAIVLILTTNRYKAEARVWGFVIISAVVGVYLIIIFLKRSAHIFDKKYWKYAITFSLPLIPHYLSQIVLSQSDRIMIGKMVGSSEAGIYGLAYTIAMMMTLITNAINDSIIPYTYQKLNVKREKDIKGIANLSMIVVAGGCIVVTLLAPEIIKIFATQEYYDAIGIIPVVSISVFFMFLYTLYGNIEFYYEKTQFVMLASSIVAVLNIILNYVFIPLFGYYAAGFTTLFCYILYSIMHGKFAMMIVKKNIGKNEIYDTKLIIFLSVVLIIFAIFSSVIYKNNVLRIGILAVIALLGFIFRNKITDMFKIVRKNDK